MDNDQVRKLSVGGWIGSLIVLAIPLLGIIMTFVWAFGKDDTGRKNFCRASLILILIGIVLGIVLSLTGLMTFAPYYEKFM